MVLADCDVRKPTFGALVGVFGVALAKALAKAAAFVDRGATPMVGPIALGNALLLGAGRMWGGEVPAERAEAMVAGLGNVLAPHASSSPNISASVGGATREILARKETRLAREP